VNIAVRAHNHVVSRILRVIAAAAIATAVGACSGGATGSAVPQSLPPSVASQAAAAATSITTTGQALLDAASKLTDPCSVFPLALAKIIVPGSTGPQAQSSPPSCEITDGTNSVVVIVAAAGPTGAPAGAQTVPGLGAGAFVEHPSAGDTKLTVLLTPNQGTVSIEITTPGGTDHQAEAIAMAQAVLAKLGG
jgi:hypothetical protein